MYTKCDAHKIIYLKTDLYFYRCLCFRFIDFLFFSARCVEESGETAFFSMDIIEQSKTVLTSIPLTPCFLSATEDIPIGHI